MSVLGPGWSVRPISLHRVACITVFRLLDLPYTYCTGYLFILQEHESRASCYTGAPAKPDSLTICFIQIFIFYILCSQITTLTDHQKSKLGDCAVFISFLMCIQQQTPKPPTDRSGSVMCGCDALLSSGCSGPWACL